MSRGPMRVYKRKDKKGLVSCEGQLSKDKRTFVMRIESQTMSWYEALQAARIYAADALKDQEDVDSPHEH